MSVPNAPTTDDINWKAEWEAVCGERIKDREASQFVINERDKWILELLRERDRALARIEELELEVARQKRRVDIRDEKIKVMRAAYNGLQDNTVPAFPALSSIQDKTDG